MKLQRTNKTKRTAILTASAVLIIGIFATVYYLYGLKGSLFGWSAYPKTSTIYSPPTSDQTKNGQQIKNQSIQNNQAKPGSSGSDQPPDPTTQSSGKSVVEMSITAANQTDTALQIRSLISTVDASGICTLTLKADIGSSVITRTAGTQALSSTSTCKGFDIPTTELSPGNWQITISYETANLMGSVTKSIIIK